MKPIPRANIQDGAARRSLGVMYPIKLKITALFAFRIMADFAAAVQQTSRFTEVQALKRLLYP